MVDSQGSFVQKISLLGQPYQELTWGMPCEIGLKSPFEIEIKIVFYLLQIFEKAHLTSIFTF